MLLNKTTKPNRGVAPAAVIATVLFAAGGLSAAFRGTEGEGKNPLAKAVVEDLDAQEAYNAFTRRLADDAPPGMEKTAATAWANCVIAEKQWAGNYPHIPTRSVSELDACEVAAVQLSVSRGYDQVATSRYVQQLRESGEKLRHAGGQ